MFFSRIQFFFQLCNALPLFPFTLLVWAFILCELFFSVQLSISFFSFLFLIIWLVFSYVIIVMIVASKKFFVCNNFIFEVFIVKWCYHCNGHHPLIQLYFLHYPFNLTFSLLHSIVLVAMNKTVFVFNNFIFEVFIVKWCNHCNGRHPFFIMLQVSWIFFFHCYFFFHFCFMLACNHLICFSSKPNCITFPSFNNALSSYAYLI